jgi:hypothetical protein
MSNSVVLYIKHQKFYFIFLMGLFVLPLGLFLQFSTYQLPKVQYVFLATLFVSQYVFYNEKKYRRKIEESVTGILKKELGRIPSRKEIYARSNQVIYYRGLSIVFSALSILFLMVYFKQF